MHRVSNKLFLQPFGLLLVVALGAVALPSQTAHAQEIQITGPLAGQPAVRRMRVYRDSHVQLIVPTVGYTLQDEFARSLMVGLEANVHFLDFIGIGVWGAVANFANAFHIDTDLTSQIIENGQTTSRNQLSMPSSDGFGDQVARLLGLASVHLLFAPLRGKLALFQGAFVEERADIREGAAQACVDAQTEADRASACLPSQSERQVRFAPAPMFGVGLNLYFNEFLGLALQWRGFPFNMNPMGSDEFGDGGFPDGEIDGDDQRFYFHHMINVGLIINLPPDVGTTE